MSPEELAWILREKYPKSLFECDFSPVDGIRVHTPFFYPDGGVVDVFLVEKDGSFFVTDYGKLSDIFAKPLMPTCRMFRTVLAVDPERKEVLCCEDCLRAEKEVC